MTRFLALVSIKIIDPSGLSRSTFMVSCRSIDLLDISAMWHLSALLLPLKYLQTSYFKTTCSKGLDAAIKERYRPFFLGCHENVGLKTDTSIICRQTIGFLSSTKLLLCWCEWNLGPKSKKFKNFLYFSSSAVCGPIACWHSVSCWLSMH